MKIKKQLADTQKKTNFLIQQGLLRTGNIFEGKMMKSGVNPPSTSSG